MTVSTNASSRHRPDRWERRALVGLLVFTIVAAGAYWNFALHPDRIPGTPVAMKLFAASFPLFARLHIVLAAMVFGYVLTRRLGARWLGALAVVYGLSFLAEHVGTGYGFPFGPYGYSDLLGPKLGGRVPVLIPLSWFLMALPVWVVARRVHPGSRVRRIALGAFLLTVWDLALDPAMSFLTSYWRWQAPGRYYGMPWTNLVGWYAVGLVIIAALDALAARVRFELLDARWSAAYYGVVLLMPVGMIVAAGLWPAVAATAVGVGSGVLLTRGIWTEAGSGGPSADGTAAQVSGEVASAAASHATALEAR
jgi:putative membrane protein